MTSKKVLLVEDEDDIREVAQMSLEAMSNWTVVTASGGKEGITQAEAELPDAILMDVMMPDMDGPTTFKHMQSNNAISDIPVILLTAKTQASDRQRFEELGVRGVIAKPFDPMSLHEEVASILGWDI